MKKKLFVILMCLCLLSVIGILVSALIVIWIGEPGAKLALTFTVTAILFGILSYVVNELNTPQIYSRTKGTNL